MSSDHIHDGSCGGSAKGCASTGHSSESSCGCGGSCSGEAGPGAAPETTDFSSEGGDFPSGSTNPCKLCTPLGACLAFKGVAGCVPLLHGSQGCATYIRRYCISHYREPIDVASSNFSEDTAVFGGRRNLHLAIDNVTRQYRPAVIGIATTCLSETMGENMPMLLAEYRAQRRDLPEPGDAPVLVQVSTPSFRGTHAEGFHSAVRALVETLVPDTCPAAGVGAAVPSIALFPGMSSPADIRHLRDFCSEWGVAPVILPDYSETLDGPAWSRYERVPEGGTTVEAIAGMGAAVAAIEFGRVLAGTTATAGTVLRRRSGMALHRLGLPIGVRETDRFCAALETATGLPTPPRLERERGRLIDSYVDAHKYLAGKMAVVYGEDDLVAGIASFLGEIGITPVLCATGSKSGRLESAILSAVPEMQGRLQVREGADFSDIEAELEALAPDLLIGSSKGRKIARALKVPLVEAGFPIHDRIGAQRLQVLGYAGTQQLFDRITNALLAVKQERSNIGYSYL